MKIVLMGTGAFGVPAFTAAASNHEILGVLTSPDKPRGRNLKVSPSPVKVWAERHKLSLFQPADIHSKESEELLKSFGADIFLVIAYGHILSKSILSLPRLLALNLHASLLPRYRGAAPIHWALLNGDDRTGVSLIRMTEKLDAGDIVLQKETPVEHGDDIFSLRDRLSLMGAEVVAQALDSIQKGKAAFTPQEQSLVTQARKLTKEDGRLDWGESAVKIWNHVRALKDWPGSYSFYEKDRISILSAEPVSPPFGEAAPPG
ncbi:MAG: methionyl-tRNA formyltransferase, partial [Candidatus Omnitrophica bacterium]|nr:methionyl-tRNA formyltransferase [Candidatus Omnitrophota bacterium]